MTAEADAKEMGENIPIKTKIVRNSSFKITSIRDTVRNEEVEEADDLEETTETIDVTIGLPESMTMDSTSTKSLAAYTDGSDPREEYHQTCTEHMVEKKVAEANACAYVQAHSFGNNSEPRRGDTMNTLGDGSNMLFNEPREEGGAMAY